MKSDNAFAVTPYDMFENMLLEYHDFEKDSKSIRHAINFTLIAYHLREWVWHGYLENNRELLKKISEHIHDQNSFNSFINRSCSEFKIVRELSNNIKHFHIKERGVKETKEMQTWDKIDCNW